MKLERSLPYFNALLKAKNGLKMSMLQSFPKFVIDDLLEVLLNVVMGRVDVGKANRIMKKHKKILLDIANTKGKPKLRKIIYNQKGGFLGAILPTILGIIGGALFS